MKKTCKFDLILFFKKNTKKINRSKILRQYSTLDLDMFINKSCENF